MIGCTEENLNYPNQENNTSEIKIQDELLQESLTAINANFSNSTKSNNSKTSIDKEHLISDKVVEKNSKQIRMFIYEKSGYRYAVGYNLSSGKWVALNKQSQKGNILNVEIAGKNGETFSFSYNVEAVANTKESCTGKHYRIMMDIIESDGDLDILCWLSTCELEVFAAAAAHCAISH